MYIDLHILQTVPYANLNRDDVGTPKTLVYGGQTRSRVSSQSWKRAARRYVEEHLRNTKTYRTRNPHLRLVELLTVAGVEAEHAERVAHLIFSAIGTDTTDAAGSVILFIAESELVALRDAYLAEQLTIDTFVPAKVLADDTKAKRPKKSAKDEQGLPDSVTKGLLACLTIPRPTTIALFGRMLASAPEVNVDAAFQVAHAFSVHPVEVEIDYFTAAEDLPNPDDPSGAAHLGTAEFVSATLYRYASMNVTELVANVGGDTGIAAELCNQALLALCLSLPTGKNNVTAPHTVPDLVHIAVRSDRPVSLAAAFEQPVTNRFGGYVLPAAKLLASHATRVKSMLTADSAFAAHVLALDITLEGLGQQLETLTDLVGSAVAAGFPES